MSYANAVWLRAALEHAKMDQPELADLLTQRLKKQYLKSTINKMAMLKETGKTKRRIIKADEIFAISEITGFPAPNEHSGKVVSIKLLGLISAGKLAQGVQISEDDVLDEFVMSGLGDGDWIALKVDGDSMDEVAPPGSIILVDRSDVEPKTERLYVFQDEKGDGTFKMFRDHAPRMVPLSKNRRHETQWPRGPLQVVGRVRRVVVDLD